MEPQITRHGRVASNVWKSYVLRVLINCFALSVPTIVLLWEQNDVSVRDGMIMQAIFAMLLALFDVPTGYLADIFGRKKAIVGASFCMMAGALAYAVAENFAEFLIGEIFLALGFSLASGADQALLFDSLLEIGRRDDYKRIWGKGTAVSMLGASVFAAVGGMAAMWSLRLPCYMEIFCALVLFGVAMSLVEPMRGDSEGHERKAGLRGVVQASLLGGSRVRWLLLYPMAISAFMQATFWLYQPYFVLIGLPLGLFGVAYALFNATAAWAAHNAYRVDARLGERGRMLLLPVVLGGSYLLVGSVVMRASFFFILLLQLVRGYTQVVFSDQLNREIPSEVRASVLSVQSMGCRLFYAALLPFVGMLTSGAGIAATFLVAAVITVATGWLLVVAFYVPSEVE